MQCTFRVYFQDLGEPMQLEIWEDVRSTLLTSGWIEARQEDETERAFERRVFEAVDHYLNTHNPFSLTL